MAIKKTELYSSLWESCDKLRGGMDASQYKDYILTLLFMKYVTDKFKGVKLADITVFDKEHDPETDPRKRTGASFDDFIVLKGNPNIGEGMDKIIARLADCNESLRGVIDTVHFNDEAKIGKGKEMSDKLTDLISIFQSPKMDFTHNKTEGDDLIGDAYEYLMRKFASESGKSKGQFYTPAEVSRILAKVVNIQECKNSSATVYDPACGSGSLLIRALAEAPFETISGYGQEKDVTTAGLARMNSILHGQTTIEIHAGNTFSDPFFKEDKDSSRLKRFDFIVANPPFSQKNWMDGFVEFDRFRGFESNPPDKNGDYAWLLHILASLKSTGKAAVILPHGVLFRGNAEESIRRSIINKGWLKAVIGLPANLFYGTGIPACILVLDKEGAENRGGVFLIDASKGFIKDGNKNRLREQDIYRIVTAFRNQQEQPGYARFVPNAEIKTKNNYNLNISRYIDSSESEDCQNIEAHLCGGIPQADIDSLTDFWNAMPSLKEELFEEIRPGFFKLCIEKQQIRETIRNNGDFIAFGKKFDLAFNSWKEEIRPILKQIGHNSNTKKIIAECAEKLLAAYENVPLADKYDVYEVLLSYWNSLMNDDIFLIASEENSFEQARELDQILKECAGGKKKGQKISAGKEGRLIPKELLAKELLYEEYAKSEEQNRLIEELNAALQQKFEEASEESALGQLLKDEKTGEKDIRSAFDDFISGFHSEKTDALIAFQTEFQKNGKKQDYTAYIKKHPLCQSAYTDKQTVTKSSIADALRNARLEAPIPDEDTEEYESLKSALELSERISQLNRLKKLNDKELDTHIEERFAQLTIEEIHLLLIDKKWFASIEKGIKALHDSLSNRLTNRITELFVRYETALPVIQSEVDELEERVNNHLQRMGFTW